MADQDQASIALRYTMSARVFVGDTLIHQTEHSEFAPVYATISLASLHSFFNPDEPNRIEFTMIVEGVEPITVTHFARREHERVWRITDIGDTTVGWLFHHKEKPPMFGNMDTPTEWWVEYAANMSEAGETVDARVPGGTLFVELLGRSIMHRAYLARTAHGAFVELDASRDTYVLIGDTTDATH